MGTWHLEVAKMTIYVMFPVAMFHYFNQPEYFEKWVTDTKRQAYPREDTIHKQELDNAIREIREKRDKEMFKALDDIEKNRTKM